MATIQIQRTRNAPTITKTAITQKQSLEIVQTMLHGSLSTLAYLRALFAEKTFDTQVYDMAQDVHSYKDYAAGKLARKASQANPPHTVMRILRRGRSRRADKFLDWLEKGAFVAIKAGHLHALQVYVHGDPEDRSKVLETYTFTFKYSVTDADRVNVTGVELDTPGSLISLQATNTAFQSMVRRLMAMCPTLPELPAQRYVSMELFYAPSISQYKPRDFVPSTIDTLALPAADGWDRETMALAPLDARFHGSTMQIMTLVDPAAKKYTEPPVTYYPATVQYTSRISKAAILDLTAGLGCTDEVQKTVCRSGSETVTPSTIVTELNKQRQNVDGDVPITNKLVQSASEDAFPKLVMPETEPQEMPVPISLASDSNTAARMRPYRPSIPAAVTTHIAENVESQSSNIAGMQRAFCGMMHPENISQGETQTLSQMTQPLVQKDRNTSFGHTASSPSKVALPSIAKRDALIVSPSKASNLKRDQRQLKNTAIEMIKHSGRHNLKGDLVLCQCGHDKEEDGMVQCTYCKTWQHLPCYGYTGVDDPRLPDEHTCYQCLLDKDEHATLVRLQDLALKRRVMDYAIQHGFRSQAQLVDDLELQASQARTVVGFLKTAGYLVDASGAHKPGYAATRKPSLVAVMSSPKHQDMLQTLFDPLALIAHHYKLPARPMTQLNLTQHLLASQAPDMPPPATPMVRHHKGVSATPGSGLDIRASMAPYETPSRPRSQLLPRRKRPAEEPIDPNIFKRFKSMQTKCVLDANGMTSSPALHTSDL
ncbi:hypothetical protein LTR86_008188 [Recurvomyces mirabilis]|nr:hypothetical protein LTR86_008188 [Recurvomyces mirabilis]